MNDPKKSGYNPQEEQLKKEQEKKQGQFPKRPEEHERKTQEGQWKPKKESKGDAEDKE